MAEKTRRLGKGLSALLADAETPDRSEEQYLEIRINGLDPTPYQPRQHFDEETVRELAESISVHGVIQPVLVSRGREGRYTLIAGERRWRAAREAGLSTIPAIVRELTDRELMEVSLIENLQREDLSAMEEAEAIKRILDEFTITQEQLAKRIGKSRPAVANALRLLTLPSGVQEMIRDGKLTAGHARAVLMVQPEFQEQFAQEILEKEWTVREAERIAPQWQPAVERVQREPREKQPDIFIKSAERHLPERLGTKLSIAGSQKKGKIVIEYYSPQELQRLYERFDEV